LATGGGKRKWFSDLVEERRQRESPGLLSVGGVWPEVGGDRKGRDPLLAGSLLMRARQTITDLKKKCERTLHPSCYEKAGPLVESKGNENNRGKHNKGNVLRRKN